MTRKITLPKTDPEVKVELGEGDKKRTFRAVPVTNAVEDDLEETRLRSVQRINDIVDELRKHTDDEEAWLARSEEERREIRRTYRESRLEAELAPFDVVLVPDDKGRKTFSQVLVDAYKANEITQEAIYELLTDIRIDPEDRPT